MILLRRHWFYFLVCFGFQRSQSVSLEYTSGRRSIIVSPRPLFFYGEIENGIVELGGRIIRINLDCWKKVLVSINKKNSR